MILDSWKLEGGLEVRRLEKYPENFHEIVRENFDDKYPILRWRQGLDGAQISRVGELNKNLKQRSEINLALYDGETLAGWSYGWQAGMENANMYMANSCVLPPYRRRGFYTELVKKFLEVALAEGFITVSSRHVSANNPVLIAKLKLGFRVSGFELSELYGNLIHLTFFGSETREEAYEVRSGWTKPKSAAVKSIFEEAGDARG